ncbi:DUF1178 family protein [Sphingomonas sp. HF-S3]|uniref:DUF1178 family protein n=1 Tax=Sphingomonas rustica TaxID=3103142 RepID=A0ABV0BB03_9SPHN
MIVFDLKCGTGHVFEAWFGSSTAYEDQRSRGLLACPMCGSADVAKAVMAPNVAAKGNQRSAPAVPAIQPPPAQPPAPADAPPSPELVKAALATLAQLQAKMLEQSQWVGGSFVSRARAMHAGEEDHAPIHGQATPEQARELVEDGIQIAALPFPVIPPEVSN